MSASSPSSLFPIDTSRLITGFTTAVSGPDHPKIIRVPLADSPLGVHKVSKGTSHNLVQPPHSSAENSQEGHEKAWEAVFPKGSINPGNKDAPSGGFGFYLRGSKEFERALKEVRENETMMGYDVYFEEGWEWAKGGKLPGIYGGVGDAAYGCTGGRQTSRCHCFNLRLMWREDGQGELYAYLPQHPSNTSALLSPTTRPGWPAKSIQHPDWGFSVGRGAWKFPIGRWVRVEERVRINKDGLGEIEVFIDGESVLEVKGVVFGTSDDGQVDCSAQPSVHGMHFQTFFGGHTSDWESPKEQRAWFRNIHGVILRLPS